MKTGWRENAREVSNMQEYSNSVQNSMMDLKSGHHVTSPSQGALLTLHTPLGSDDLNLGGKNSI